MRQNRRSKLKRIMLSLAISLLLFIGFSNAIKDERFEYREFTSLDDIRYEDTLSAEEVMNYFKEKGDMKQADEIKERQRTLPTSRISNEKRYVLWRGKTFSYKWGVWDEAKVQQRFTVEVTYGKAGTKPRMTQIAGVHVYTGAGSKCAFAGKVYLKLISGNSFYYNFYGNLYVKGQPNWNVGISVGIGKSATINASISNGDGFIRNISESENFRNTSFGR